MADPFESLAIADEPRPPRPEFARDLRAQLIAALELTVPLPDRRPVMPTATTSTTRARARAIVPYICVADAAAALDWYADVFGATETMRVVGDDGRVGHAELQLGDVTMYLSDEYRDYGVAAPAGDLAAVTLYLTVDAVDDLFARAVAAGAQAQSPLADQPDGDRRGTLVDPFGHRWMLAQPIERPSTAEYAERIAGSGYSVAAAPQGAVWSALVYRDAQAGIAFLTDVLGFVPDIVVADDADPTVIHHSQLRWPEGGVVQVVTAGHGSPYADRPTGTGGLYMVTADPQAVWERCQAAGVEVVTAPYEPDYAPGTMGFGVRDFEGNLFSFGHYAGET